MSNASCPNNPSHNSMSREFKFKESNYSYEILYESSSIRICLISFSLRCEGSHGCKDILIKIADGNGNLISQGKIKEVYGMGFHGYNPGGFSPFISIYDDAQKIYQINIFPTVQIPLKGIRITLDIPPANNKDYKVGEQAKVIYQYLILHDLV